MSNVTFAICHFRFSPIGLEIFVSNPHPSLFFRGPVFIFRSEERFSREDFERGRLSIEGLGGRSASTKKDLEEEHLRTNNISERGRRELDYH